MQQLKTSLTDRSDSMLKVGIRYGVCANLVASWGRLLSFVLMLLSLGIVASVLPSAVADENTSVGQFKPDDAQLHRLVSPCLDCHATDEDSADYVGPTLKGIVGRRAANITSYGYSAALYQKAAVGLIWDEATLDRFLEAPLSMVPGIAKTYDGVPNPDDRAQLIAWLATGPVPVAAEAPVSDDSEQRPEVTVVLQIKADTEYGEYLAGKCLTCHSSPGASGSVPPIKGLPANYFVNAMLEYQQGQRSNQVMQTMSAPLGTEELAALTAFFAHPAP